MAAQFQGPEREVPCRGLVRAVLFLDREQAAGRPEVEGPCRDREEAARCRSCLQERMGSGLEISVFVKQQAR